LYSGTNPEEATNSATSLIKYISKKSNVSFILTTHYINLCKKVKNDKQIINQKMNSFYDSSNNNKLKHTFKIKRGISKIKGGFDVLTNMNYPSEILDNLIT
jgi:DNA mismatch repair ATPase MutS